MGIFSCLRYALCQTLVLLGMVSSPANASHIWEGSQQSALDRLGGTSGA